MSDRAVVKGFIPEEKVPRRRLGRSVIEHDPKSREYPIGDKLGAKKQDRPWWRQGVFDQGNSSSCTFQAQAGLLVTSPMRREAPVRPFLGRLLDPGFRMHGYRETQRHDPWPGEEPQYEGSSTLASFKAAIALGIVPEGYEYRWAFGGAQELADAVTRIGPAAVGTVWTSGMDNPDPKGRVKPTGQDRGGHAYQVIWYENGYFVCVNSWGSSWARKGRFFIAFADMDALLRNDGEAALWVPAA